MALVIILLTIPISQEPTIQTMMAPNTLRPISSPLAIRSVKKVVSISVLLLSLKLEFLKLSQTLITNISEIKQIYGF